MSDLGAAMEAGSRNGSPPKKRRSRSIAGLDRRTLAKLDRRTVEYQRYAGIRAALIADKGGETAVSEAEAQLVDRCAFMAMRLETMQIVALAGEEIDLQRYGELTDRLRRGLESIGLQRRARDITPSLRSYLTTRTELDDAD